MMKSIWKFPLAVNDKQAIQMPKGAKILTVQVQGDGGLPCIWALCDTEAPLENRLIAMFGTGHQAPEGAADYIGTFQLHNGEFVFHVFEMP